MVVAELQTCIPPCTTVIPTNGILGSCTSPQPSGTTCSFQCNTNYVLSQSSSTCTLSSWSSLQTCIPPCVGVAPTYGNLGSCGAQQPSGTSCSFQCNTNYLLSQSSSVCTNSVWTSLQTCISPCTSVAPANGNLGNCPTIQVSGAPCLFQCNTNYVLSTSQTTCSNGAYTPQTCLNPCTSIPPPINGYLNTCSSGILSSGTSCQYACNWI